MWKLRTYEDTVRNLNLCEYCIKETTLDIFNWMSITFIVIKLKLCSINFLTYQNIFALDLDRQSQPFSLRFLFIFYFIRLFCLFLMIKRFFYFSSFYLRASTNIQLLNCVVVCIRLINFWLYTFIIKYCVECTYVGISKKK